MLIYSLDIGKKGAIVVFDTEKKVFIFKQEWSFDSLLSTYLYLKACFKNKKADLVVIGEAFGHRQVVKYHSKFYGGIELICEQENVQVLYVTDRTARATVLGKGNGNKKELVHQKYQEDTPDISDACLFISYYLISTEGIDSSEKTMTLSLSR